MHYAEKKCSSSGYISSNEIERYWDKFMNPTKTLKPSCVDNVHKHTVTIDNSYQTVFRWICQTIFLK